MRKLSLSIILILLILGCYQIVFGSSDGIRKNVASVSQLRTSSKRLSTEVAELEKSNTKDFEQKKKNLSEIIENYRTTKQEYDQVVEQFSTETAEALVQTQENELKDIYDVDFLWTIIGNYATEEGINLNFDIVKNITAVSSLSNTSTNFVVCDLKFVITGNYINLTDFIYDLEDDDRLNFEINDFDMQKSGDGLQVSLIVKEVKINATNLIESAPDSVEEISDSDSETQTVDSTTTSKDEQRNDNSTSSKNNNVN